MRTCKHCGATYFWEDRCWLMHDRVLLRCARCQTVAATGFSFRPSDYEHQWLRISGPRVMWDATVQPVFNGNGRQVAP